MTYEDQKRAWLTKVAALEVELIALEVTVLRVVSRETSGKGPGPEASMLKIKGTEVQQALTELMVDAIGPRDRMITR